MQSRGYKKSFTFVSKDLCQHPESHKGNITKKIIHRQQKCNDFINTIHTLQNHKSRTLAICDRNIYHYFSGQSQQTVADSRFLLPSSPNHRTFLQERSYHTAISLLPFHAIIQGQTFYYTYNNIIIQTHNLKPSGFSENRSVFRKTQKTMIMIMYMIRIRIMKM